MAESGGYVGDGRRASGGGDGVVAVAVAVVAVVAVVEEVAAE